MNNKLKRKLPEYDFDKPIKLLEYKSPRFDIIFYSAILSLLMVIIMYLIFVHDGEFRIDFVLWRVLICIPLLMLSYWFRELLNELRVYPKLLMKKHIWTIKELMEMTGKDRKSTETIMSHVFESCFIVDKSCLKK
ncbi:MAG: hypothetical protein IJI92_02955 [Erysipelotrichaceae bacterium]|nr:hypothetical protein [Erysipelotrichaceae bacterium]